MSDLFTVEWDEQRSEPAADLADAFRKAIVRCRQHGYARLATVDGTMIALVTVLGDHVTVNETVDAPNLLQPIVAVEAERAALYLKYLASLRNQSLATTSSDG